MNWEMIGHHWAVDLLQSHIHSDQVRHAYLFTGPMGIGKRTLATRFAQALNCMQPPEVGTYCGECRACSLIQQGNFPDLHIVSTQGHDRTIKVDQIRELQAKLSLSPYEGKYRVALFPAFHQSTDQAANALLKTLEEPPAQVILLLTAESTESLLATIVSRCEIIPLRTLPLGELEKALEKRLGETGTSKLLAGISAGRPGYALQMAQDETSLHERECRIEDLVKLLGSGRIDRFDFVERWDKSLRGKFDRLDQRRSECIVVLELWLGFWRDVLLDAFNVGLPQSNPDRHAEIQTISSGLTGDEIVDAIQALEWSIAAIQRNANLRLALEGLMIELPYCTIKQRST